MARLLSGKIKKVPSTEADVDRYSFISLENTEPDLGVPASNGQVLVANTDGARIWTSNIVVDSVVSSNIEVDGITFTSNVEYAEPTTGELHWNLDEGTLDLGLEGEDVTLHVGQESLYRVTNQSGNNISQGDLVVAAGTTGSAGKILIDVWDGTQTTQTLMGLAAEDIADDADGYVIEFGKLRGIDTTGTPYSETWANGDILYAASNGGLTNVQPEAPNTKTIIALVIYADATVGELFVRPTFSSDLGSDDLVQLTSLANNQIIRYDNANSRFENVNLSLAIEQTTVNSISIGTTVQQSNTANTTSTSATTISEWPTATYNSSKAVISAVSNGERQISELLISHNSSNAHATEYGVVVTDSTLFTVDCTLSGANVVIQVTAQSTTATDYVIHETLFAG